jgi:hypothetical protein
MYAVSGTAMASWILPINKRLDPMAVVMSDATSSGDISGRSVHGHEIAPAMNMYIPTTNVSLVSSPREYTHTTPRKLDAVISALKSHTQNMMRRFSSGFAASSISVLRATYDARTTSPRRIPPHPASYNIVVVVVLTCLYTEHDTRFHSKYSLTSFRIPSRRACS